VTAYASLERIFSRIDALEGASGILSWDARTTMPSGASETRGEQLAALRELSHAALTDAAVPDLLAAAAEDASLEGWQAANLREMTRIHARATALPDDLVGARERAANLSEMAWRAAREASDFAIFLPHLKEVLALEVRAGEAIGAELGLSVYDALLDGYDPGMREERVDAILAAVSAEIPELIGAALEAQGAPPPPVPGPFPIEGQRRLWLALMDRLGFDATRGRLDVSAHPFCGGSVDDVRITTRSDETGFLGAVMGIMHETGHALYEQGLPAAWRRQPVGKTRGMTLHESQSLSIEMQACRTRGFAEVLAPLVREHVGVDVAPGNLHRMMTRVQPGLVRVDADEITYPAHVILRFDIERALISGELAPDELPGAFDDGMRELLRLRVPNDRLGCLQDIHWACGNFGYFPTYTLGAMAAAQLCETARTEDTDIAAALDAGDLAPLVEWMRTNVHAEASLRGTKATLERATGSSFGPDAYLRHLRARYVDGR
jgi:carboxypeptidase Taq